MVKLPRRHARAKKLIRLYKNLRQDSGHRGHHRILRLKRQYRLIGATHRVTPSLSSLSSLSSGELLTTSDETTESEDEQLWADVLGPDWRGDGILGSNTTSLGSNLGSSDDSELLSLDHPGSDSSSHSSSGYRGDEDSELDSDILEVSDAGDESDDSDDVAALAIEEIAVGIDRWGRLRRWVQQQIHGMYENRYEVARDELPRGPSRMRHVLFALKNTHPGQFREELRVTPLTFDTLVTAIIMDPIFENNSYHPQMPVEEQLAITLYRFGHDGNAASLQGVANWAAVGKGTVLLVTRRVMTAILRPHFMDDVVCFPTTEEKEMAKEWVHRRSCKAWRNGWCLVDGTLIPLAERPHWYGESYFDRKSRYSLNIQASLKLELEIRV